MAEGKSLIEIKESSRDSHAYANPSAPKEQPSYKSCSQLELKIKKSSGDISAIQKKLALWFRMVYEGKATLEKLYEKGKAIEDEINKTNHPNLLIDDNFADLREALDFIDELHDPSVREYLSGKKEQIYYYMRRLS